MPNTVEIGLVTYYGARRRLDAVFWVGGREGDYVGGVCGDYGGFVGDTEGGRYDCFTDVVDAFVEVAEAHCCEL